MSTLHNKNEKSVLAIILARLDSSRLPNKALRLVNNKPLISYCIDRSLSLNRLNKVVLATTDRTIDDPLAEYALQQGIEVYRGNAHNVARRCVDCARFYNAKYFLRVNGDSPFIDKTLVNKGIDILRTYHPDLITNLIDRTYPYGVSVEIVNVDSLESIINKLTGEQSEHVTKAFYDRPSDYNVVTIDNALADFSNCRMVVDDLEDFRIFEEVCNELGRAVLDADYMTIAETYKQIRTNRE